MEDAARFIGDRAEKGRGTLMCKTCGSEIVHGKLSGRRVRLCTRYGRADRLDNKTGRLIIIWAGRRKAG